MKVILLATVALLCSSINPAQQAEDPPDVQDCPDLGLPPLDGDSGHAVVAYGPGYGPCYYDATPESMVCFYMYCQTKGGVE